MKNLPFWQNRPTISIFLLCLVVYLITLQPSLAWGDGIRLQREAITGESFILAELTDVQFAHDPFPFAKLGVAAWDHPLWTMLGYGLVHALPFVHNLWLVNSLSAVFGALAIACFFQLLRPHLSPLSCGLASLALAFSHTFWWHSTTPEVYTLFLALLLGSFCCLQADFENPQWRTLAGFGLLSGLGMSNHLLAAIALPPVAIWALWQAPRQWWHRPRTDWLWLILAGLLGFLPFVVQLLRMLRTFPLAEVLGPALGENFFRGSLALSLAKLLASLRMYAIFLIYQFAPWGVGLGVWGWWKARQTQPQLWALTSLLYAVYAAFGWVYQVSDQFAFFLASHVFWAMGLAMGIEAVWQKRPTRATMLTLLALTLILPLSYPAMPHLLRATGGSDESFGIPAIGANPAGNSLRDGLNYYLNPIKTADTNPYSFGTTTLQALPANALVLAEWYTDTDEYFALRYFQAVEGLRPDVQVEGYPRLDPFNFPSDRVSEQIRLAVAERPVYLASLNPSYYGTPSLTEAGFRFVPENGLWRVVAGSE
ncbi:MAG TPA: glycosyltransferase family 39 protein [Anaerolineales bacterium]|nr:glycosyltransferase family 39 protein [Anaerolineales bacterium]